MEITNSSSGPLIDLFEGNNGSQNRVCSVAIQQGKKMNFKGSSSGGCTNDEARSLVFHRAPVGTLVRLYDHPDGKREDDWSEIEVVSQEPFFTVSSFQKQVEDGPYKLRYFRNNGLDGKVSRLEILGANQAIRMLSFYEGNRGYAEQGLRSHCEVERQGQFQEPWSV